MAAAISFYSDGNLIGTAGNSGLGFYGSGGFGASVAVAGYQGRTFIASSNGASQGAEGNNVVYVNLTGATLGQSSTGITLNKIPNAMATLNIRSTFDTAVQVQNVKLWIYDRTTKTNPATGVTTKVYEVVHPDPVQNANGSGGPSLALVSGAHSWLTRSASTTGYVELISSPGTSGLRPSGSSTTDTRHDHYVALSASPDSIGSKALYGAYLELEYL